RRAGQLPARHAGDRPDHGAPRRHLRHRRHPRPAPRPAAHRRLNLSSNRLSTRTASESFLNRSSTGVSDRYVLGRNDSSTSSFTAAGTTATPSMRYSLPTSSRSVGRSPGLSSTTQVRPALSVSLTSSGSATIVALSSSRTFFLMSTDSQATSGPYLFSCGGSDSATLAFHSVS